MSKRFFILGIADSGHFFEDGMMQLWFCTTGFLGAFGLIPVSYTHLTLPTTPYV